MKKIKVLACVLTAAMVAGLFAGCSKTTTITTEKFAKACEKLKLEEFDLEDSASPDYDDLEDGLYAVADEDYVEDNPEEIESFLNDLGLGEVIDADDVTSLAFAAKCSGAEDFSELSDPEDLPDQVVDGAFALQISLADDYVGDAMDFAADLLDQYDVDVDDLSNKEYYAGKKDGYIRFHVDVAAVSKILLENEDLMDMMDTIYDADDFEEIVSQLKGDLAVSFEINGNNIFIIAGVGFNTKASNLNSFAKAFGAAANPVSVPANKNVVQQLIEDAVDNYGGLLSGAGSYDDYDDWDI